MLGNPDYRNFDREGEEWVYTTTEKNLIVGFYNDIVESMTTFPTGTYYGRNSYPEMSNSSYPAYPENNPNMGNSPAVMSDKEYQDLYTTANRQPFREDKMTSIRNGVYGRAFTCRQCVRMMSLFTFDDEKLQVFNIMAPNILDWENQHLILDNFKFVSSRDKAMQTIQSIRKR